MRNRAWCWLWAVLVVGCGWGAGRAAEKRFDWAAERAGSVPAGFHSAVAGEGLPGDWRVVEVGLGALIQPGLLESPGVRREAVVAQLARNPADEHFPMLVYEGERFGDFTLSARVRTVAGEVAQMAGLVFRWQDERNFYVVRVSSMGNTVRFYKVVDGIRSTPIGPELAVERGVWHRLKIECEGNQIRCWFNDRELFPALTDNSFTTGRIGLWTKSDAVSEFTDLALIYRPEVILARRLVQQGMSDFGRLVGLKIYAAAPGTDEVHLVASSAEEALGVAAGRIEAEVAREGTVYHGKERGVASVVLPLRDRNGDPVAALRVQMKSFVGQTRDNALVRAKAVADRLSREVKSRDDLFD
jgi:hypothetical protein